MWSLVVDMFSTVYFAIKNGWKMHKGHYSTILLFSFTLLRILHTRNTIDRHVFYLFSSFYWVKIEKTQRKIFCNFLLAICTIRAHSAFSRQVLDMVSVWSQHEMLSWRFWENKIPLSIWCSLFFVNNQFKCCHNTLSIYTELWPAWWNATNLNVFLVHS